MGIAAGEMLVLFLGNLGGSTASARRLAMWARVILIAIGCQPLSGASL